MSTKRGWIVVAAGIGVNLMLGTLYAWGVISSALIENLGWSATQSQIPYMVACALFAFSMVPGGKLQDSLGPKPVIIISAVLAGIGLISSGLFIMHESTTVAVIALTICFGLIFGASMGMGYAAPTPAAVKWFSKKKRGIISGIVVSGFGLAPLYVAPITTSLIESQGLARTFYFLGGSFCLFILILSQFISNPPKDYVIPEDESPETLSKGDVTAKVSKANIKVDYEWKEVLKTKQFKSIWTIFCFGTFAGLLTIGQLSSIGREQAGITNGFILVGLYAVFNAVGRVGCGVISDKLGRTKTLFLMFVMQVAVYFTFPLFTTPVLLIPGVAVIGFTFGGMLTLFPSITADFFGMKNLGVNYGLVITAWGIGGVLGPLLGGLVRDFTGAYTVSYMVSGVLSVLGAIIALRIKAPVQVIEEDKVVVEEELELISQGQGQGA
ncbi:OFA family MFS transporter [Alkalicella caledoniensis]|uniref:OFA family MFS transporter n=1 Tax=Alkalicella caledoniensis TaxID=2731377 RepID=A0A7G9W9W7_ALKCA|nr:OFA family MFS transporter [Alkalicella caledoniensis]QNO15479.1 OFA family MFS transporter [Alkalicella caledoniensis]